jgi:AcrR family transcriptional regulator
VSSAAERDSARPTRERILDAAERLVAVHGMEGLRLVDVAAEVGIRPPSLFAHFAGREAIGDAVAERVVQRIAGVFAPVLGEGSDDPRAVLRRGVRAFAAHLYDHPADVRMLLRDLARVRGGEEMDLSSPVIDALARRIGAVIEAAAERGRCRPLPAGDFMAAVQGATLGILAWSGFGESGEPLHGRSREDVLADVERMALALLAGEPAGARGRKG